MAYAKKLKNLIKNFVKNNGLCKKARMIYNFAWKT